MWQPGGMVGAGGEAPWNDPEYTVAILLQSSSVAMTEHFPLVLKVGPQMHCCWSEQAPVLSLFHQYFPVDCSR
jgi:hypothetical protein